MQRGRAWERWGLWWSAEMSEEIGCVHQPFFFLSPRVLLALEVALEAALGILMLSGSRVEKVVVVLRSLRLVS